jgi:vacuolar-type H+-ATPase subunit F/Vma7
VGRLVTITTPDLAAGFQLAGVETFAVNNVEEAEEMLQKLLAGNEASLIVVRRGLLHAMSPRLQRQVERSVRPVVMDIPGSLPDLTGEQHHRQIMELIRRTVGFHITFGTEQPESALKIE